jgi:asparagine synthase (glutamine-hydrolysing)
LAKRVPKEILDRKKAGFPVPCGMWLRGALNGQVRDVVLSDQAMSRGYFQKDQVTRLFDANANGSDYSREIFCLLTLELWHRSELLRRPEPTPS